MIPIWAKDKQGKWQVFPQGMLETFPDGVVGYNYYNKNTIQYMEFVKWKHLFTHDRYRFRFVLNQSIKDKS